MTTRRTIFFAIAAWALTGLQHLQAQDREAALIHAMKKLGENWQLLSRTQDVLIIPCPNNTFTGVRLASGAVVSVDLEKTNSLVNYLGIVRIRGRFQRTNSAQDGSCSKSPLEATRNVVWHDNNQDFDMTIYYHVNGDELWLTDGNVFYRNSSVRQPGAPQVDPDSAWLKAFRFPIM